MSRALDGRRLSRRSLLQSLGAAAVAAPFVGLTHAKRARASATMRARRVVFFYFPDGVAGTSQNGDASEWHPIGGQTGFSLPRCLEPLGTRARDVNFLVGLSSGGTDSGSHPGGAKKLLTGVDGGGGMSLDQFLAHGVFSSSPWRHLYLGAHATVNNASGDKFISYPTGGQTVAPEDNPRVAFARLFGGGAAAAPTPGLPDARTSILDVVKADLADLRGGLGTSDRARLDTHLQSVREVETRLGTMQPTPPSSTCAAPSLAYAVDDAQLYDPARFPEVLGAQIDVAVLALSCGMTRCVTLQASHHTSELIMSRFPNTEMFTPNFDMRSHQASHYGAGHDDSRAEYRAYVLQRRYFVAQYKRLLDELASRPDPEVAGATLLDTTLVLLCSEVSDGNTHSHDDLPLVLAGSAAGLWSTGRHLTFGYERHHKLLTSIARACGADIGGFGQDSGGTLGGLSA